MARRRDYASEYRARLAKAERLGLSRQAGRGHRTTPERPERAYRAPWERETYILAKPERLAKVPPDKLAEWNLLRALEGKHELSSSDPGGAARRQVFPSAAVADDYLTAIPIGYVTLFPEGGAWAARINRKAA